MKRNDEFHEAIENSVETMPGIQEGDQTEQRFQLDQGGVEVITQSTAPFTLPALIEGLTVEKFIFKYKHCK